MNERRSVHRSYKTSGYLPLLTVLAVGLSQSGCSRTKSTSSTSAGPVQLIDPATVGEIRGTVTLTGSAPAPRKILLSSEPECAQLNPNSLFSDDVIIGQNNGLSNVAVYIKSGLANYKFDPPASPAQLAQKNCMYEPRVVALMTNQMLDIQNEDPIQHNVHPTPHNNPAFNQTQPIHGSPIQRSFSEPELAIRFACNLHPWMHAYVFVFAHPYFDVTSNRGSFDLKNVPPGSYTVEAWQEKYGTKDQTITIGKNESKTLDFSFGP